MKTYFRQRRDRVTSLGKKERERERLRETNQELEREILQKKQQEKIPCASRFPYVLFSRPIQVDSFARMHLIDRRMLL